MSREIAMILPTRDYRASLNEAILSWQRTSKNSDLYVLVDNDQAQIYAPLFQLSMEGLHIIVISGPQMNLVEKLNWMALQLIEKYLYVGFVADDVQFITENWDTIMIGWHRRNLGITYANDLLKGEELPNNVVINSKIVKELGFMCPPVLNHYYIDNFWKDLGLRIYAIMYYPGIIIEHKHHSNGKAKLDTLYRETQESNLVRDNEAYDKYVLEGHLANDAEKVRMIPR